MIDCIGRNAGITITELADDFGKTRSACSQMVKKLRDKGWVEQVRNKENNDEYRKQYLLKCKEYIDVFDNNAIFIYCNLWSFATDLPYNYKTLEEIVLESYQRYSLVGLNDDILAMLYYQIGRIYESKHDNFEAINFYNKSIEVFRNSNNIQRIIQAKISIAGCYFDLKDYDKAEIEYLRIFEESS